MRASRVGLSLVVEASTQREGHVAQGVVADPPTRPGFPPLQPSLTRALLSMCQSERPLASSASSVHLALCGFCIPCPQDAHSVHCASPAKEFGFGCIHSAAVYYHALPPHPLEHPAQARNRLLQQLSCRNQWSVTQALPQSSGRAAQPFQAVDAGCREERGAGSGGARQQCSC